MWTPPASSKLEWLRFIVPVAFLLSASVASATDEIQVYDASIAKPGQFTLQQHLNYVFRGHGGPDYPGALVSNHSLNGTPELAYGIADWWEAGLYAPFAVSGNKTPYSDGVKIRQLFVSPHAEDRSFFYGVNFELSYETPPFSQTRAGLEIRPIIGFRHEQWELIINPIVDAAFGKHGEVDLAPAVRLARKVADDVSLGVEYYANFGRINHFAGLADQQHSVFGVVDFKVGKLDVEVGLGRGLTAASDKLVGKVILGTAF